MNNIKDHKEELLRLVRNDNQRHQEYLALIINLKTSAEFGKFVIEKFIKTELCDKDYVKKAVFIKPLSELAINISRGKSVNNLRKKIEAELEKYEAHQRVRKVYPDGETPTNAQKPIMFGNAEDVYGKQYLARAIYAPYLSNVLTTMVERIAALDVGRDEWRLKDDREFYIESKIAYNHLEDCADEIRDHAGCESLLDTIYNTFDSEGKRTKDKVLQNVRLIYQRHNPDFPDKERELYHKIKDEIKTKILTSSNVEGLTMDDIDLTLPIIVAHAFDHCEIFKKPETDDSTTKN